MLEEHVELRNGLNSKSNTMRSNMMAQAPRGGLERTSEKHEDGCQEEKRVGIDEASGEELKRVRLERSVPAGRAYSGKTIKERNISDIKHGGTIPPGKRMP